MDDLISRKAAVSRMSDLLMLELKGDRLPTWNEVYNAMQEIPSAQPDIARDIQRGGVMTDEAIAKALDEVEDALIRAVEAKKDIDIVVALRAITILMQERLKNKSLQ